MDKYKKVDIKGNNFVNFNGKNRIKYELTSGMLELSFKAHPKNQMIDGGNKKRYKDTLSYTLAHKRYYYHIRQVAGSGRAKHKTCLCS